jgi:hypothetical protein
LVLIRDTDGLTSPHMPHFVPRGALDFDGPFDAGFFASFFIILISSFIFKLF